MWLGEVKLGGWRHSTDRWRLAGGAGFREVGAGCGVVYVDGARSIKLFCSWELHQVMGPLSAPHAHGYERTPRSAHATLDAHDVTRTPRNNGPLQFVRRAAVQREDPRLGTVEARDEDIPDEIRD